jgi:hypothetical protein
MERVLVGGGGDEASVFLRGRDTKKPLIRDEGSGGIHWNSSNGVRSESQTKSGDRDDKWKQILSSVAKELRSLRPAGNVRILYEAVKTQIDASVKKLARLDVDNDWGQIIVAFQTSRARFQLIRLGVSVVGDSDNSISRLFDVLISGLTIDDKEWNELEKSKNRAKKNEKLEYILRKIGTGLKKLNKGEYYNEAIGGDAASTMENISNILQGIPGSKSKSRGSSRRSSGNGWKERLTSVMGMVDQLEANGAVAGQIFKFVKQRMHKAVSVINELDLNRDWDKVNTKLHEKRGYFLALSQSPKGGEIFNALYDGMSMLEDDDWISISGQDESAKDVAMDTLLKTLGDNLAGVSDSAYESILKNGGAGKMKAIARMLQGEE